MEEDKDKIIDIKKLPYSTIKRELMDPNYSDEITRKITIFKTLRDFLFTRMRTDKRVDSFVRYRNIIVGAWYYEHSHFMWLQTCLEQIPPNTNRIIFEPITGEWTPKSDEDKIMLTAKDKLFIVVDINYDDDFEWLLDKLKEKVGGEDGLL